MSKFKKLIVSFLLSIFVLINLAQPAKADTWFNQDPLNWYKKVYDTNTSPESEIFGERYTAAQVQWIFYTILTFPLTVIGSEVVTCLLSPDLTCVAGLLTTSVSPNTAINTVQTREDKSFVQYLLSEDRPLSGISYTKSVLKDLKIIPEANAQTPGFGFGALEPVRAIWGGMRNMAYILLIMVTLVLAFMVMFRVKISPQVVITAQSAIPKVALAIVLITFSYAIAGFLVDLVYVVIGLFSLVANTALGGTTSFERLVRGPIVPITGAGLGLFGEFFQYILFFLISSIVVFVGSVGVLLSGLIAFGNAFAIGFTLFVPGLNLLVGGVILLLLLIVFILLIIHFIRILWMLVRSLANVLLLTIFAPIQLLLGAVVPNLGFGTWLRSMAGNLSVFVAVPILLYFARYFLAQSTALVLQEYLSDDILQNIGNVLVGQPLVNIGAQEGTDWPPLLGLGTQWGAAVIMLATSFVIFTIIPRTAEIIQGAISGRPFAFGTAIGEAVAPTGQIIGGGVAVVNTATNIGRAWTTRFGLNQQVPAGPQPGNTTTPQGQTQPPTP